MCYKAPGPRCTPHAKTALDKATEIYRETRSFDDYEKLQQAKHDYELTPGGQKDLEEKISQSEKDKNDDTEELKWRLDYAKKSRKKALEVIKAQDRGDIDHEDKKEESPITERLKTMEPSQVDTDLAEIYEKYDRENTAALEKQASIQSLKKRMESPTANKERLETLVLEDKQDLEMRNKKVRELQEEMEPYNTEFSRRGGWSRAFLVTNTNGHVHSSMDCDTCFDSTQFSWLPSESGKDESKIVEAAGEKACTTCYPDAPVDVLSRPSSLEDPKVKEAREKRVAARDKKKTDQVTKGLTDDGSPLAVEWTEQNSPGWEKQPDGSRKHVRRPRTKTENFKTERAATTWVVGSLTNIEERKAYPAGGSFDDEEKPAREQVIQAIMNKHDKTRDDVQKDLDKKVKAKIKRDARG